MDLKKRQFPIPDGKTTDISELYHPSEEGLKFIMDEEGYRPSPYDDLTKKPLSLEDIRDRNYKGNPTIGYGHKLTENELKTGKLQGRDIYAGIDEPTARKMVSKEDALKDTRAVLLKALKGEERVKMTPEQLDALYSFGYNVGPGVLEKEVLPLRGNQDEMIKQMQKYNKSKGQELPGLIERRKIEGEMMKGRKYQQGGMPTPEELNQLGEEEGAMSQSLPQRQPASVETPTELQPQPDMLNQMMREYQDLRKGEADQLAKLQEKKKTSDWLSALSGIASIGGQVAPNKVDIKPIDFSQNVNQEIEGIGAKRKANLAELAQMYDIYSKMKPKTLSEVDKARINLLKAQTEATQNKATPKLTKGQETLDREFARTYNEDVVGGGFSRAKAKISRLDDALGKLESGSDRISGRLVGKLPDLFRSEDSLTVEKNIKGVIQESLRPILGAQFTEKEGELLLARTYDPNLDEATNAKRLKQLIGELNDAVKSKEDAINYYEENGTLAGFKGKLYTSASDFMKESDLQEKKQSRSKTSLSEEQMIQIFRQKNPQVKDDNEARAILKKAGKI